MTFSFISAVREDRTPGGKHRNKRIHIEGHHGVAHLPDGTTTTTIVIPQVSPVTSIRNSYWLYYMVMDCNLLSQLR